MKPIPRLIQDMLGAIDAIETYQVLEFDTFKQDNRTQDAIMYNLIVLGEAANRISEEYQSQHPEVPWDDIIGTRHVIVHGYDHVRLQIVWDILQKDLQSLKENLQKLI